MLPIGYDTPASDSFEWWTPELTSEHVSFLGSDDLHDGTSAVSITSDLAPGSGESARLEQSFWAATGATYAIGFWVKSTDAAEAAVRLTLNAAADAYVQVPAGTYDWTYVETNYVPDAEMLHFRISVEGPTGGTTIDSLSVTGLSGGALPLMNGGFESSSYDLTVINPTLLFPQGSTNLQLATRRSTTGTLNWSVTDRAGAVVDSGDSVFEDSRAIADLRELSPGLYTATINAVVGDRSVDRSTTIAVLDEDSAKATSSTSPFGVFLHYAGGTERLNNLIATLGTAGIKHARIEMNWDWIELTPGTYAYPKQILDATETLSEEGISPLLVPAYANPLYDDYRTPSSPEGLAAYTRFAQELVTGVEHHGAEVEVYNEFDHTFNTGACGHTPECYMEMLTGTATGVKAANPDATIVAPGNAGMGIQWDWLSEFFELGGLDYTDVVSAHPYVQPEAPEMLIPELERLGQMIRDSNGGESKPIWLSEMGWASVPNWVTEESQAQYLVRTMAIALGHGVSRVYWFEAANGNAVEGSIEGNFGLFEAPSTFLPVANEPKEAAVAQAVMAKQIDGLTFSSIDETAEGVYSYVFSGAGTETRVMWTTEPSKTVTVSSSGKLSTSDMYGASVATGDDPKASIVELTGSPVYVSGAVTGIVSE
ncbi:glycosyl hydrolase [Cryobacterium sp. N22]|uniref:glycosyl hydrolase n=1 Tax=Cryobacterium sp. N22 TaxID=2048290 RepID=UPI001304FD11|nr:glycosyl hydrolase [Cryobacterium sp. N22]